MTRTEYKSDVAAADLAVVIASETSGLTDSIPEEDDRALAELFVKMINHEYRHIIPPELLEQVILSTMESTGEIMMKAIKDRIIDTRI